jgi:hypothetical protein
MLARQAICCFSQPSLSFLLVILEIESPFLPSLAWISIFLLIPPEKQGWQCVPPYPDFSVEMGSCKLLCPGRPGTVTIPISAYQGTRIRDEPLCSAEIIFFKMGWQFCLGFLMKIPIVFIKSNSKNFFHLLF